MMDHPNVFKHLVRDGNKFRFTDDVARAAFEQSLTRNAGVSGFTELAVAGTMPPKEWWAQLEKDLGLESHQRIAYEWFSKTFHIKEKK